MTRGLDMGRAYDLEVATNSSAPPAHLAVLAVSRYAAVRRAVAQNPNTPLEALVTLAEEFAEEVVNNPAFALYELVEPVLPRFSPRALREVARLPVLPEHFVTWARRQPRDWRLQENLMVHPALPLALRRELFCEFAPSLELTGHWGPTVYQLCIWLESDFVGLLRRAGCRIFGASPSPTPLSDEELEVLRRHGGYALRLANEYAGSQSR